MEKLIRKKRWEMVQLLRNASNGSKDNGDPEFEHCLDPIELEELAAIASAEVGHPEHLSELLLLENYSPSQWAKEVLSKSLNGQFKRKRGPKKPRLNPNFVAFLVGYAQIVEGQTLTDAVDVTANGLKVSTREVWRKLDACELSNHEKALTLIKQSSKVKLLALRDDLLRNGGK